MENFKKHDFDCLHDVVLNATWDTTKRSLSRQELEEFFRKLPENIQQLAFQFGMNDTVFRDEVFSFVQENKLFN